MTVLIWTILSLIVAYYATTKGKSGILYFFISLVLSPLIGLIVALIFKPNEHNIMKKDGLRKCSYCKELIKKDSVICKHCRKEVKKNSKVSYNNDLIIEKHFENDTYYISITNYNSTEISNIKESLKTQYEKKGYDILAIDTEKAWKLKSSHIPRTYIQLNLKNKEIKIEAYNVPEEPIICKDKEISKSINTKTYKTEKLLELSKMLDKGLISEDEFKDHKKNLY